MKKIVLILVLFMLFSCKNDPECYCTETTYVTKTGQVLDTKEVGCVDEIVVVIQDLTLIVECQ